MLPRADKSNEKEEKKEDCLQKCIKVKWTDKRRTQPSTLKQSLAWGRDVFKASLLPKKQNKSGSNENKVEIYILLKFVLHFPSVIVYIYIHIFPFW